MSACFGYHSRYFDAQAIFSTVCTAPHTIAAFGRITCIPSKEQRYHVLQLSRQEFYLPVLKARLHTPSGGVALLSSCIKPRSSAVKAHRQQVVVETRSFVNQGFPYWQRQKLRYVDRSCPTAFHLACLRRHA